MYGNSTDYHYECGCDGGRCTLDDGTRLTRGCGNAAMELICDDTNCSVGVWCGNRFIPRFHLDFITTNVGIGAVCSSTIPKGTFIVEYEPLLHEDALAHRGRQCGNESRFINHSCSPNCELYEWEWANRARLGIFAATVTPSLQELTFRYRDKNLTLFACQCGQQNCVTKQP
ncbi:hypothetical protein PHMEG_00037463 [Phytophthora megakarya]|uniref:SET domain-containing protein n=1 Tax=Phytophthora megakarya TaxID=4795 RepID=A0A225UJV3_9STRA|nr:hypothetical protein PHMEG_00037463 [Phytophthora megakarya]